MFRILLKEFKCWKNLSIEIPLGGVTLIKGDSGCGKSTILQAIVWCLYGKIQLVTPTTKKVASTEVTIRFPFHFKGINDILNITRKKSTRVTLSHCKDIYEDKVAQEIINDLFGTYDLWLASCYVGQGTRNTFLTTPNSGKMELLNSIAFHEEDPRIFIDRITEVLNEKNTVYNIKLSEYNINVLSLESMMSHVNIDKGLSKQQHEVLLREIDILNLELLNLQIIKKQYDIDNGILSNLYKQLSNLTLEIILPKPRSDLQDLMNKYNYNPDEYDYHELNNIIMLLYQKEAILEKGTLEYDLPLFNMEDYRNIINNENTYNYNYDLLSSLNINCDYNTESIKSYIENAKNVILYNEYLCIKNEHQLLSNNNVPYIDTIDLLKELGEIKKNINELELIQIPKLDSIVQKPNYSKYNRLPLQNDIIILQEKLLRPVINENIDDYNQITQKINDLNSTLKTIYQNTDIDLLNIKLSNLIDNINIIKTDIYKLELSNKLLKCPKCFELLNFEKDELIISNNNLLKSYDELKTKKMDLELISSEIDLINNKILDIKADQNKQFNIINNEIKILSNQLMTYDREYDKLKVDYEKTINNEISLINKKIDDLKFEEQTAKFEYDKEISSKKSQWQQEKQNKINKLKDEHNKLELKITRLNSDNNVHINNQKQIKILESKLSESPMAFLDSQFSKENSKLKEYANINEINEIKDKIQKLSNIKVVKTPLYHSEYVLECINHNERKEKYINIIDKIPLMWRYENPENVKFYNESINEYVNILSVSQKEKIQVDLNRKTINDQINEIKNRMTNDPHDRMTQITNILYEYEKNINLSNEANKVINYRDNLIINREKIIEMNNELVNLQLLKQRALETECKSLQDVISSINLSIETICSTLFDREISIMLSLFKTIKSTKSIKPNVNFQISYKGGVFDNISSLSGGEGDRTSIALTLSLYRLNAFPLLMLDETLASLHYDMKEATVETLTNIINNDKNRCVIVVLHDSVNGIFENVIDLEEITEGRY